MSMVLDIHSHVLPKLDDGSPSLETSLAMVTEAVQNGVTHLVATPHYCPSRGFRLTAEEIRASFDAFSQEVAQRNIPIRLFLGEEIYCSDYDDIVGQLDRGELLTLNGSRLVLLEYSPIQMPKNIYETLYNLNIHGYRPVIAHAERYRWMTVDVAEQLKEEDALIHINGTSLDSLSHRFLSKKLMNRGLVDAVASDAHYGRKHCFSHLANAPVSEELLAAFADRTF